MQFRTIEIPNMKHESWKYTNLSRLLDQDQSPSLEDIKVQFKKEESFLSLTITGQKLAGTVERDELQLRDATKEEKSAFFHSEGQYKQGFLSQVLKHSEPQFLVIDNPKKLKLKLEFQTTYKQYDFVLLYSDPDQNCVEVTFTGDGQVSFHQRIDLAANKEMEQVVLQKLSEKGQFLFENHITLQRDARASLVTITKGASLSRSNIACTLQGENSQSDIHGLYLPTGKSHHDTDCIIEHAAPHTYSKQVYKGILADSSKGIFAGLVKVKRNCPLIEAEQLNKNLLLTSKAQAFSRPQMQIDTDDVKCAHGSTTGQLSEAELFYFESRGIRKDKARKMLADGFAQDVILKIKNKELRERARKDL